MERTKWLWATATAGALSVGVSCGGPQAQPETPEQAPAPAADEATAKPQAWSEMNREQRMEFMGLTVLPEMKKLFQEADPEGYAEFKCQTCHGADMKEVDFKMPNGLFELTKPNPMPSALEYDEVTTKFMAEKVVPKMAELLQMEPGKEFNCFSCHEAEEVAAEE